VIKLTEEKLLAFEVFLNQQRSRDIQVFETFSMPQPKFTGKAIIDILEEENCLKVMKASFFDTE